MLGLCVFTIYLLVGGFWEMESHKTLKPSDHYRRQGQLKGFAHVRDKRQVPSVRTQVTKF